MNATSLDVSNLGSTSLDQITDELLTEAATQNLRSGRKILKTMTSQDKKEAVRTFLTERMNVQWLPTCCICKERRISDGVNIKLETSIPKRGHIFKEFPGKNVCQRCKDEKLQVKKKGDSAIHAYSINANMFPGETPLVLSRLSKAEVLAISRIHMLSQVIQLRYGVYGYRGSSIYLMNNILHISDTMPRRLDDLSHVWLRLLFPGNLFMHHDYIIRKSYVIEAFEFLLTDWKEIPSCRPAGCELTRNPAYADLSMASLSQEILDTYPEDGVPENFLKPITQEELDLVEDIQQRVLVLALSLSPLFFTIYFSFGCMELVCIDSFMKSCTYSPTLFL